MDIKLDEELLLNVLANSYKNFHVKGFDYICTQRSENLTLKYYFFDGDVSKMPEVVNPHDHRYDFRTTVLNGSMVDYRFQQVAMDRPFGQVFNKFKYMTPLNGGNGFTYDGEIRLNRTASKRLENGFQLFSPAEQIHTISMREDHTVIRLEQQRDVVPLDQPTTTFSFDEVMPDSTGLYERFTVDEVIDRLHQIIGLELRNRNRRAA